MSIKTLCSGWHSIDRDTLGVEVDYVRHTKLKDITSHLNVLSHKVIKTIHTTFNNFPFKTNTQHPNPIKE